MQKHCAFPLQKVVSGPLPKCSLGCATVRMHGHLEILTGFSVSERSQIFTWSVSWSSRNFTPLYHPFPPNTKRSRIGIHQKKPQAFFTAEKCVRVKSVSAPRQHSWDYSFSTFWKKLIAVRAGGKEKIKAVLVLDTFKIMILKVICMRQNEILPHRKRGQN